MTTATISDELPSISEELQGMTENLACLENDAKTMWKMIRNISRFALEITRKTEDSEIEEHSSRYCKNSKIHLIQVLESLTAVVKSTA